MVKFNMVSPEVLIYIQNLRVYFTSHEDAQKYFAVDNNEDTFFEHMTELSQKNFDEFGEPQLTVQQFEDLKHKISKFVGKNDEIIGSFISLGDLGYISLN
jgi:hypothetical protein